MNTAFVIDGFNFYHSIKRLPRNLRWFDYDAYCRHFLRKEDVVHSINYCTAVASWRQDAAARHRIFIDACKAKGIIVIEGKFKEKTGKCEYCGAMLKRHEEKETDVNVALAAYRLASQVEQVFIVSGDSDLIPAMRAIKTDFPEKLVGVIFPFNRLTKQMKAEADISYKTRQDILPRFILPPTLVSPKGTQIHCPD